MGGGETKGFAAGLVGTAAMAGTALTVRRLYRPPGEVGKTHYEHVAEWAWERLAPERLKGELNASRRCRLGECLHYAFGGLGGLAFSTLCRRRNLPPTAGRGLAWGTTMWMAAFGGYMPWLGITGGLRDWDPHERLRTFVAHAAYGVTSALILRALQKE